MPRTTPAPAEFLNPNSWAATAPGQAARLGLQTQQGAPVAPAKERLGPPRRIHPVNIINQWLNEEWARGNVSLRLAGPEFDALVARKLRVPEWRFLRTDG